MRHVTSVVDKNANRRPAPAPKNKQAARERIRLELLSAPPCQRIDAFAAVHGFHRHQDAHLRGDLNHAPPRSIGAEPSHNARLSATSSAVAMPLNSILIRPRGPSNSTRHSGELPGRGAISSTNAGGRG